MAQIMSSAAWLCFAGIYDKFVFLFRNDHNDDKFFIESVKFEINYFSWVYMLAFIPMNFIANWVIELKDKGMRKAMIIGMTL